MENPDQRDQEVQLQSRRRFLLLDWVRGGDGSSSSGDGGRKLSCR